ncbi:SNF2-related protein [Isachenkonia alkalipeptolytica]|uniref:DEAD/DEAH box helicase n=1 Tax=Isachenkonia alkalipeptolytica TaxID=2565777 RepID=A0AA43XK58_9CLOT|nr:SNF2-related protein [Isachenkonia alkalipeptolytica]NBG88117.1 DEAD/DEAH box helicase [Isachenkonia alkalipeptolytica]
MFNVFSKVKNIIMQFFHERAEAKRLREEEIRRLAAEREQKRIKREREFQERINELDEVEKLFDKSLEIMGNHQNNKRKIKSNYEGNLNDQVRQKLKKIPIEKLSDIEKGIRISALKKASFTNLDQLIRETTYGIRQIHGIGEDNKRKILNAANKIKETIHNETHLVINLRDDRYYTRELVRLIFLIRKNDKMIEKIRDRIAKKRNKITTSITYCRKIQNPQVWEDEMETEGSVLFCEYNKVHVFRQSMEYREWNHENAQYLYDGDIEMESVWDDFEKNSIAYYSTIEKITGNAVANVENTGGIPDSLSKKIENIVLDISKLKVELRQYQTFGVKYSLTQKKVLIGDEMGLGKTIEAIAVMAHLSSNKHTHFLAVVPTSVLINWEREVAQHSKLETYKLHGNERKRKLRQWIDNGGVGITTYGTLGSLGIPHDISIDCLVVDEAHYIKNSDTKRTKAVMGVIDNCDYIMFMSGTPLENNLEEMKNLIGILNPRIINNLNSFETIIQVDTFKSKIAEVYLRRNRNDVLKELPDKQEINEWSHFDVYAKKDYFAAVNSSKFMSMRRAAWSSSESNKLKRLLEICKEAENNERKIVIFSYFRDVINIIHETLKDNTYTPITGDVSSKKRQEIIDAFSENKERNILISQVEAGGIGLNIQAASVVILCEPQLKPSIEEQAISRVYRMGQTRKVMVHRLLTENSVDERIMDILTEKQEVFDSYAKHSDAAELNTQDENSIHEEKINTIIKLEKERIGSEIG